MNADLSVFAVLRRAIAPSVLLLGTLSLACAPKAPVAPEGVKAAPPTATTASAPPAASSAPTASLAGAMTTGMEAPKAPNLIARIGGQSIARAEFEPKAISSDHYLASEGKAKGLKEEEIQKNQTDSRRKLFSTLLDDAIFRELAAKSGVEVSAEELNKVVAEQEAAHGGPALLEAWLKPQNLSREEFAQKIKATLLARAYAAKLINALPPVSEADIQQRYALMKAKGEMTIPGGADCLQITFRPRGGSPEKVWEAAKGYAQAAYARIQGGEKVDDAAAELSQKELPDMLPTAFFPFLVGAGQASAEAERAAASLEPGKAAPPIKVSDGWAIVCSKGNRPEQVKPLDEMTRNWLNDEIGKERRAKVIDDAIAEGKKTLSIEIFLPEYADLGKSTN